MRWPRPRRRILAVGLGLVAVLALQPALADRLSRYYFAPNRGEVVPPPMAHPIVEEIRFPATDGSMLCGWWWRATKQAPRAVVVVAHGNASNLEQQWDLSAPLVLFGHDVLMFDYRGFGESPGRVSRRRALEDVASAIAEARRRSPELPLVVLGQSMGAALALEACAERDDVAALIADSPFDTWHGVGACAVTGPGAARACLRGALATAFARSGEDPVDAAAKLRVPLLVIAGTADDVTPVEGARAIHAACPGSTLLELPGAPHVGRRTDADEQRVTAAQSDFIARVVGVRSQ